jgi:hypothetical protein
MGALIGRVRNSKLLVKLYKFGLKFFTFSKANGSSL